jgi:bacterial/archaeal transporter family-2 protein
VGLFVTGQVLASLGLDLFGLIGVPRKPFTIGIALGVLAVLVGIGLIIRQRKPAARQDDSATARAGKSLGAMAAPSTTNVSRCGWIGLGVIAGAVLPVQGAVNAQLRTEIDAPFTAGMISFIIATLAIAFVLVVMVALRRTLTPQLRPLTTMPWWGWLGGLCAAAYVTATFLLIPVIGAATTVALTVTGQQLFSAVIDEYGLFRMPARGLTSRRAAGLAGLVLGSVLVQLT